MGTTRTAILNDTGVQLAYVLLIEGYSRPLTTWGNLTAVDTAYDATDFTNALPGLEVTGNIEQRFRPFSPDLEPSHLSFRVVPEEDDVFGTAVFNTIPGVWSELSVDFNTDNTTLQVKNGSNFAGSGTVYVGTQAIAYTSQLSGIFAGLTAGKYSPFSTDTLSANVFPSQHLPNSNESVGGWKNTAPPLITDRPRTWLERRVGLFAHRVVGGVLDVHAQSELLFAGRIDSIQEDGDGATILECSDYRAIIGEATVFTDQWRAVPKEGFYFQAGTTFNATLYKVNTGVDWKASQLDCVSGTPADTTEFQAGLYTAEEIASIISDWLNNDATITGEGGAATWKYHVGIASSSDGIRFRLAGKRSATSSNKYHFDLFCSDRNPIRFLGLKPFNGGQDGSPDGFFAWGTHGDDESVAVIGEDAPFRMMPIVPSIKSYALGGVEIAFSPNGVQLAGQAGTFRDMTDDLPPELRARVESGETWSMFSVDDKFLFVGKVDSAASPTEINDVALDDTFGTAGFQLARDVIKKVRVGEELPVIKQVACISGTFENVITRLFASTDGKGTNHANYDDLPDGIGIGVPWSLLGQNWLDSLNELEEASDADSVTLIVEKPMKTWDLIAPELVMRGAFLRFSNGGYQLGTIQIPNASNADWTLDEDNKSDSSRTRVQHTREFAVSQIKIEYDREPLADDYRSKYIAVGSNPHFGEPLTIKARNSYSGDKGAGEAAETLCEKLTAELLAVYNRPLLRWRRSIAPSLFLAAPGDTVSFTDLWTRSPTTGQRGASARGATILAHSYSFGVGSGQTQAMNGSVELLFSDEDRFFPMSYAAESDESLGSSAWDSGAKKLYLKEHAFSLSSGDSDNTYFSDTDAVRVVEIDPADPSSPDEFTDVISGDPGADGTGDYIILTDGFGGSNPAFDSSKIYLVVPDDYGSVTDDQKLQAFQADDSSGYIDSTIKPNLYGKDRKLGHSRATITRLPARHSTSMYGDGRPLTPAHVDQGIRMLNNLVSYKMPVSYAAPNRHSTGSIQSDWQAVDVRPLYIGDGRFASGRTAKLVIAPAFQWDGSADLSLRLRLVQQPPFGATAGDVGKIPGTKKTATWTVAGGDSTPVHNLSATAIDVVRSILDRRILFLVLEAKAAIADGGTFYGYHVCYMREPT